RCRWRAGATTAPVRRALCTERTRSIGPHSRRTWRTALPDLSVELPRLALRGPVLAASGTFGYGTEVPLLERRALGGIVSKGIFLRPRPGTPPPRIVETPAGMLNAIGLQGPGVEALVRDYCPLWAEWDFP